MQGVRIFGRLFFTRCRLDVRRIWQPESNRISMRWQFHGVPRIPWEVEGIFDGVSQFKLDRWCPFWTHDMLYPISAIRGASSTTLDRYSFAGHAVVFSCCTYIRNEAAKKQTTLGCHLHCRRLLFPQHIELMLSSLSCAVRARSTSTRWTM